MLHNYSMVEAKAAAIPLNEGTKPTKDGGELLPVENGNGKMMSS